MVSLVPAFTYPGVPVVYYRVIIPYVFTKWYVNTTRYTTYSMICLFGDLSAVRRRSAHTLH